MIAIDVMGGDNAPQVVLKGALEAAKNYIPIALHGPEDVIVPWLEHHAPGWQTLNITIHPSSQIVAMDEDPVFAVRKKTDSSLVKAVASVATGSAQAVLSAGNSGALMVASALIIGRQQGVERPAIAGFLPVQHGTVLALDLGANTECRPHHLLQFAQLGTQYLKGSMGIEQPRVSLLSNGHEAGKGSILVKEAYQLLASAPGLNFVGNTEPAAIFAHKTDIVVCDGFSGNVLLKTMEAVIEMTASIFPSQAAVLEEKYHQKAPGGALLLGIKGTVIVCHGNADAKTIENAISFAWKISHKTLKNKENISQLY
jgi:phosphate acyltransferase